MSEKLSDAIAALLPAELAAQLRDNIEAVVGGGLERMNLVTREQFAVQEKVLQRTRAKVTALESQVALLEQRVGVGGAAGGISTVNTGANAAATGTTGTTATAGTTANTATDTATATATNTAATTFTPSFRQEAGIQTGRMPPPPNPPPPSAFAFNPQNPKR